MCRRQVGSPKVFRCFWFNVDTGYWTNQTDNGEYFSFYSLVFRQFQQLLIDLTGSPFRYQVESLWIAGPTPITSAGDLP